MGKWQSTAFKLNAVEKALGRRDDETLEQVAQQIGIGYSTLTRWMTQVNAGKLTPPSTSSSRRPEDWSAQERWQALIDTAALTEAELGVYCRRHGLYTHHLQHWKDAFMRKTPDETTQTLKAQNRALKDENKRLQRELHRKEKALAEAAALMILKKKVQGLYGEDEDN